MATTNVHDRLSHDNIRARFLDNLIAPALTVNEFWESPFYALYATYIDPQSKERAPFNVTATGVTYLYTPIAGYVLHSFSLRPEIYVPQFIERGFAPEDMAMLLNWSMPRVVAYLKTHNLDLQLCYAG